VDRFVTPSGGESLLLEADEPFPRLARGADRPAGPGQLSPLAGVARRLLPGTRLQAVTHHGLDRVVSLELAHPSPAGEADWVLIAEMFGRQPNLSWSTT
jgi:predicted ribosome quality control (RQC) complex YloA/Tae2 family protein